MVTLSGLRTDFKQVLVASEPVRIRHFNISGADTGYDGAVTITTSGPDTWVSGVMQPIDLKRGSDDPVLLEQGKILTNDLKMFVDHTVDTSGTFIVGIGSANPPDREYKVSEAGIKNWEYQGGTVYKKVYLTFLTNGSLISE